MSDSSSTAPKAPIPPDSMDLLTETRSLKRKLIFWQRAAWLLVGGGVILVTIIWQRGELRRRECFQALQYYSGEAKRYRLGDQPPEVLEQQWQHLDQGPAKLTSIHYDLIVANWRNAPKPGESIPMAVCRDSHLLALSRGRYVLYRETSGETIRWLSESEAAPIVAEAAKDH